MFTGDTLHWNRQRQHLDVFPRQTWYSWDLLADSIEVLAERHVEWVFPGHGIWHRLDAHAYTEQMHHLAASMRQLGRTVWSAH